MVKFRVAEKKEKFAARPPEKVEPQPEPEEAPPVEEEQEEFSEKDHLAKIALRAQELEIKITPESTKQELLDAIFEKQVDIAAGFEVIGDRAQIPKLKNREDFFRAAALLMGGPDLESLSKILQFAYQPTWGTREKVEFLAGEGDDWKQLGLQSVRRQCIRKELLGL